MGRCANEKNENIEKIAEEILAPQYFRQVRKSVEVLEKADIPLRLIRKQQVRIEPLGTGFEGVYDCYGDIIVENADTTITAKNEYIYAHETGHKILTVKNKIAVEMALQDAYGIVPISNERILKEILCDEFGMMVSGKYFECHVLDEQLSNLKREGLQRLMLQLAWSV